MNDIWIDKQYAQIYEIKVRHPENNNKNGLRVWCTQWPDVYTLQIRTHKPTNEAQNGKPRNMIAHANVTIEEVENILAQMKRYARTP